jgi:ABC-type phosphate transport system substrate-binding protein
MKLGIWALGVGILLLAACAAPPSPTPIPLRLAATDLAAPLLSDLVHAYTSANPNVAVVVSAESAATSYDLALTSTPESAPFATPLGYVPLSAVVQPGHPIAALSLAQVREIFAGRITDWAQVGGAPGAIQVIAREDGSDGARAMASAALNGVTPNAFLAPTWEAMRTLVAQNPGALGYLPAPEIDETVRQITLDVELRALIVAVAPDEPEGAARDFLAWAQSEAGQVVVAQRYESIR